MEESQSWSIIIFSYNEKGNVERVVERVIDILPQLSNKYELIIIDDGSTDGSEDYLSSMDGHGNFTRYIRLEPNRGIGGALKEGYMQSTLENVCAVPGDGQFEVEELLLYKNFPADTYLSYYRPEKNYNFYRDILTYVNKWMNRILLGLDLKDVNWIKVYKREAIEKFDITVKSSLIESELCAKLNILGSQPIEVPSKYLEREFGEPKAGSFKTVSKALSDSLFLVAEIIRFKLANRS